MNRLYQLMADRRQNLSRIILSDTHLLRHYRDRQRHKYHRRSRRTRRLIDDDHPFGACRHIILQSDVYRRDRNRYRDRHTGGFHVL